ncbi:MAG: hypothetical protein ACLSHC_13760 [Bilophila wadsworthia]
MVFPYAHLVAGFCYTPPLAFLASVPGGFAVPLFVSGAAQGFPYLINDVWYCSARPMTRRHPCCKRDVRSRARAYHALFSIISMKWLWDGAMPPVLPWYIDSAVAFLCSNPYRSIAEIKAFTLQLGKKGPEMLPGPFVSLSVNQHILKI